MDQAHADERQVILALEREVDTHTEAAIRSANETLTAAQGEVHSVEELLAVHHDALQKLQEAL